MPESSGLDLSRLEGKVNDLNKKADLMEKKIDAARSDISDVKSSVNTVSKELTSLKREFEKMIEEQKKQTALQEATTEFVRVRQELEQRFGNYSTIRRTMIGILQATDAALVKKTTISNVSEELMLSSPEYWLAPCLVAVAAWIGNNRDLAERAITEAVKRDEERTALVMALICRRNNRVETCYEWLSVYFSNQNAGHFSAGAFAYVSAYINGVFGPDTMHMCDDYVERWLSEIQAKEQNFAEEQQKIWKEYCEGFVSPVDKEYPQLKESVPEFRGINGYVERLRSVDTVSKRIQSMKRREVDQEKLKEDIDKRLIILVREFEKDEVELRREEKYFSLVKKYRGDTEAARLEMARDEKRESEKAKDLVGQMVQAIKGDYGVNVSQQKTAISFLGTYIEKGMEEFTAEKKDAFPKQITISVEQWKGATEDGANREQMKKEYVAQNEARRQSEVTQIETEGQKNKSPMLIGTVIAAVLGLISFFALSHVAGVVCFIAAAFLGYRAYSVTRSMESQIADANSRYDELQKDGQQQIEKCVDQWLQVKKQVAFYEKQDRKIA